MVLTKSVNRERVSSIAATRLKEKWIGTLFSLPVLVPFIVFGILPLIWLIAISFTNYDGYLRLDFRGFDNYVTMFGDERWWRSVVNSLVIALGTIAIQVPLAFLLAILLHRKFSGNVVYRTIFFLPYVVPAAVSGIILTYLVQPTRYGVFNDLFLTLGWVDDPVVFLGDGSGAIFWITILAAWSEFGFTMILFLAGLQTISPEIYEASEIDGVNFFQKAWYITLPMIRPIFNIVMLLAIVSAMKVFDIVKTLTNGGPAGASDVMFTYLYNQFFGVTIAPKIGYAASLAVTASIIIAIVVGVYFFLTRKKAK